MNPFFEVGDLVSHTDTHMGRRFDCTVVKVMPVEHAIRSYHIRDETEGFERAVDGSTLTRVRRSAADRLFDR